MGEKRKLPVEPERWLAWLEGGMNKVAGVAVVIAVTAILADVTSRAAFNAPLQGSFELVEYLLAVTVFMALSHTQAERLNIRVDALTARFSSRGQAIANLVALAAGLAFFVLLVWQGTDVAWATWKLGERSRGVARWPEWPAKAVLVIGSIVLCLRLTVDISREISRLLGRAGRTPGGN